MDDLIELLAEDSHIGWMQEKQRQGYADHVWKTCACGIPDCELVCLICDLPKDKHHPDMLPYAELPEHIKEYDRVTVRGVLAGIERHGYKIVKFEDGS